jgi:tRNA (guanine37-N1)-methyltransferase
LRESFGPEGVLEGPQYTRPADFRGWRAPDILLGGNHEEIRKWRRQAALEKTARMRPDLLESKEAL